MTGVRRRIRHVIRGCVAALLSSAATTAFAQQSPEPLPPAPDTTTITEPVAGPDVAPPRRRRPRRQRGEGPRPCPAGRLGNRPVESRR